MGTKVLKFEIWKIIAIVIAIIIIAVIAVYLVNSRYFTGESTRIIEEFEASESDKPSGPETKIFQGIDVEGKVIERTL